MTFDFPKPEHYSNQKLRLDKNLLKSLKRVKEEREEIMNQLLSIQNQCEHFFNSVEIKKQFKDIKNKFNDNLKSIFYNSDKNYPENVFKKEARRGKCETCNKKRGLEKVHIIKKSVFRQPYSKWSFLRYHPSNILFLCPECHDKLENRFKEGDHQTILSKGKFKRMEGSLSKRNKKIRKAIKVDEKYMRNYKKNIDAFNDQKMKMLDRLIRKLA